MNEFIMLTGLPASGKSEVSEWYRIRGYKIHSSDSLRLELMKDESDQSNNEEVFKELYRRVKEDLVQGNSVVLDSTNLTAKRRKHTLSLIFTKELKGCEIKKIVKIVACPYNICVERNKSRDRTVPIHVIETMYKSWQTPMLQEGFDEIDIEYTSDVAFDLKKELSTLSKIGQYNKNHTLTIGKHCKKVARRLKRESKELYFAGMLHDAGKKFCGRFKDTQGRVSEDMHFYNHESVSSYDALFYNLKNIGIESQIKISQLICYHMLPHILKTDKSINKRIKFFGQEFWDEILTLHESDKRGR